MHGNGHSATSLSRDLYRIGEVSRLTETKAFVLRYWETEFPMLQPVKSASGQRMYRRQDVDTVLRIKRLLYDEGFTIAGARRHLRDAGSSASEEQAVTEHMGAAPAMIGRKVLLDLRDALRGFLTLLESE
jgi:DNA-binding transcriptional MerR regulator